MGCGGGWFGGDGWVVVVGGGLILVCSKIFHV